ncbi:exodeoxyribonuclease V subunit alpha [Ideonella sp.]|uniref:exodeoxyribonuclease V subunit alpha n=1 Tax=Ideonella sp. TaxID=1929293 RepID=UPI0035B1B9C6
MRDLFDVDPEDPGPLPPAPAPSTAPSFSVRAEPVEASSHDSAVRAEPAEAPDTSEASDARLLAEGFAQHLAAWADPALPAADRARLADAARAVSLATSAGHVCTDVAAWRRALPEPPTAAELAALLGRSGVVGTPDAPGSCPLILDAAQPPEEDAPEGRLYLHRHFDLERRLATRVAAAASAAPLPVDEAAARSLRALFGAPTGDAPDWQQVGAALALTRRLTVISGGPGTGKTTTVVNLLAALLAQSPDARIALAAPTGKAAARMTEAIRARAQALDPAIAARLPAEGSTIHRLLGAGPEGFRHGADDPLPIDALVVDEASMLDLALATQLLEAVPPGARIVLLGDKDQLAAVEAGSVFADLSADPTLSEGCRAQLAALCAVPAAQLQPPAAARRTGLADTALWFTRNYRFAADSGIGRLAVQVRDGLADEALATLRAARDDAAEGADVRWIADDGEAPAPAAQAALRDGYAAYLAALRHDPTDVAAVTQAFGRFRVLCALRQGPRGTDAVNAALTQALRAGLASDARLGPAAAGRSPWWPGRPVMVQRNDYGLRLFNGDIGLALPDVTGATDELRVYFPSASEPGGFRAVAPARLPAHDTAFAMTVHKSQGSEFEHALVLLPARRSPVCTRELLYTGITRARARVTLVAGADAVRAATAAPTRRQGGLVQRLAEALAAGRAPAG